MANRSKYNENLPSILCALFRRGYTDTEACEIVGIHRDTLSEYRKVHLGLDEACRLGKRAANALVENALYRRAIGYDFIETTREGGVIIKTTTKHIAPDVAACMAWLTNRDGDDWKHRQQFEHSGPNGEPLPQPIIQIIRSAETKPE